MENEKHRCANDHDTKVEVFTGADGKADLSLFPGKFSLCFVEGSGFLVIPTSGIP